METKESEQIFRVLFVDDEPNILQSIKRALISEHYVKLFAMSGQEALDIMSTTEVHVIVSDMRMPGMSGLDLLKIVSEKYPNTVKIVLSGFNQITQVFATINTTRVFKYLPKPWDADNELIPSINEALEQYKMTVAYKQFNLMLEKKNEFYQKLLKANDEKNSRLKADSDLFNAYIKEALERIDEHLLQLHTNGDHAKIQHEFVVGKRIMLQSMALHNLESTQTSSEKILSEMEQLKTVWTDLILSKNPNASAQVLLNLSTLAACKSDLPFSLKQFNGALKLILFNLYAINLQTDSCFDFTVYSTYLKELEKFRLDVILQRSISPHDNWLESFVDQGVHFILNSDYTSVKITNLNPGKMYSILFQNKN